MLRSIERKALLLMFSLGFTVETEIQLGFDGDLTRAHLLMLGFRVEMEVLLGFDDG